MAVLRILFDTNILIKREDPNILPTDFIELNKIINDLNYKVYIHPLSIDDINRDKDYQRRDISLSKLQTYTKIQNAPVYTNDSDFKQVVGIEPKINDKIDNSLIYAVYKNAVDLLITEDKGILAKAKALNLENQIINISDAILLLSKNIPIQDTTMLSCFKEDKGWNINLNDTIFDTLKNEYDDFNKWWQNKICKTERPVYVYYSENPQDKGKIKAILIIKEEDREILDSEPPIVLENILKICLFKVDESTRGMRLGERLLKMAFEQARIKNKTKLYLTHYTTGADDRLVSLIETYGFHFLVKKKNNEDVFYKEIKPPQNPIINTRKEAIEINRKYFPSFYDGNLVSKYIVPIQPKFFDRLFPDYKGKETQLNLSLGEIIPDRYASEGFSIQKAYICNTPVHTMKEGDILCFYGTEKYKSILTLGTIEKVHYNITDAEEIYKLIKNRTVYTLDEIKIMCSKKSKPVVILFKHNLNFINEVTYNTLLKEKIVSNVIQTVRQIKQDSVYKSIIKGNIDESLIINKA